MCFGTERWWSLATKDGVLHGGSVKLMTSFEKLRVNFEIISVRISNLVFFCLTPVRRQNNDEKKGSHYRGAEPRIGGEHLH